MRTAVLLRRNLQTILSFIHYILNILHDLTRKKQTNKNPAVLQHKEVKYKL